MKKDVNRVDRNFWNTLGIIIDRLVITFRRLWKNPLITIGAIISITLGIGACTAIFTIFDEYLLRPLPAPEPGRLVNFSSPGPRFGSQAIDMAGGIDEIFSYPTFRDLENVQNVFTHIAAHRQLGNANMMWRGIGDKQQGMLVSGGYFPALGLKPAIGRLLGPDDDKVSGDATAVVLSSVYMELSPTMLRVGGAK